MNAFDKLCSMLKDFSEEILNAFIDLAEQIKGDLESSVDIEKPVKAISDAVKPAKVTYTLPSCPKCSGEYVVKNGHKDNIQRFLCKDCGRTFAITNNTIMEYSHFGQEAWEQAIADTLDGKISLDKTAEKLGTTHKTAFFMRHKILMALDKYAEENPTVLRNISELDETYVLESQKGIKFGPDAPREPRKHGAIASKRGISDEQICIMTGVQRDGGPAFATTCNRAHPSKDEIVEAFSDHIEAGSVAFTDGLKGYKHIESVVDCIVESVPLDEQKATKTANLNNVNGFHSHIKELYNHYRGVATKYLNRYNTLFSVTYRSISIKTLTKKILGKLGFNTYNNVKNNNLLMI